MAITSVTAGPPRLTEPAEHPPGETCRYGGAFPFQVAPGLAAVFSSLRNEGYPVGDFENGGDVILFDDLDRIDPAGAVPIVRNDTYVDARGRRRINIHYPIVGGFVPLGALREDGSPHPHAGTGFGIGESLDFPLLGKGHYSKSHKRTKVILRTNLYQLSYDTHFFLIDDTEVYNADEPLRASGPGSEWPLIAPPLKQGVPDGDAYLTGVTSSRGDLPGKAPQPGSCGVARWQRREGAWAPVAYVPVVRYRDGQVWTEPSLVRDVDGALLFTSRGVFGGMDHTIRVWQSTDGGEHWRQIIDQPEARGQAPVTINQAADGTPYVVCNKLGRERDWLVVHPLSDDRTALLPAIDVRNALAEFGPPPKGPVWFMDHPMGETLQFGDGQWRHVLSYRNMDRGEHAAGGPTPVTGQFLEEVISDGPPRPVWTFA